MIRKRYVLLLGLFIFIVSFLIYANSLGNEFLAGDDQDIILNNHYLTDWKYLPNLFTENYKAGSGVVSNYWRPLQLVPYLLIARTIGITPLPFHVTSILFHAACGILLYIFVLKLFSDKIPLSILAGVTLLWVVHPIANSEIALTTGLASPGYLFGILLGLVSFMLFEERKKWAWYVLSLASFAFSFCSKEAGIVFPALLLGMHITGMKTGLFEKTKLKGIIIKHLPFWVLAALYVAARLTVLNFQDTLNFYAQSNVFTENFFYRAYTMFTVIFHGLRIIFVPAGLHSERSWFVYTKFLSAPVVISFFTLTVITALAIAAWKKNPLFTFGIFFFFASYFPMSNLFAKINALVWDHWFYVPSIGIFLSLASLCGKKFIRNTANFVILPMIIIFTATTISRNPFWKDTETVSRFILRFEPERVKTWNNLGIALADKGESKEAIECYLKAIGLSDEYPETHHNLANEYLLTGKHELAEAEYKKAISMDGNFYHSYIGLGNLYLSKKDINKAAGYFRKALEIYPHLPQVREFLSKIDGMS